VEEIHHFSKSYSSGRADGVCQGMGIRGGKGLLNIGRKIKSVRKFSSIKTKTRVGEEKGGNYYSGRSARGGSRRSGREEAQTQQFLTESGQKEGNRGI